MRGKPWRAGTCRSDRGIHRRAAYGVRPVRRVQRPDRHGCGGVGHPRLNTTATLPELGPWLGRLCSAGAATRLRHFVPFDDIRLALATGVLELAGAARGFSPDDHAAIVGSLHARNWRRLWETALDAAATRTAEAIDSGFATAAAQSRFPKRHLARLQVSVAERAAMKARLGAGAIPFEESLVRLEDLAGAAGSSARGAMRPSFAGVTGSPRRRGRSSRHGWLSKRRPTARVPAGRSKVTGCVAGRARAGRSGCSPAW